MNKKYRFLSIFCLLILIITSCQIASEIKYDIPKNEDSLESTLEIQPSYTEKYHAPTSWIELLPLEFLSFQFDAPVKVPDIEKYPVYSVARKALSFAEVYDFIHPFILDAKKYAKPVATKEYYEREILAAKQGYYDFELNGFVPLPNEKELLAALENLRRNAPEYPDFNDMDSFLAESVPFYLEFYFDDKKSVIVSASEDSIKINNTQNGFVQPESWVRAGYARPNEPEGTLLENVKLSKEEALKQAHAILANGKLDYLTLIQIEKARLVDDRFGHVTSEGWVLSYGRGDGGFLPVDLYSQHVDNVYSKQNKPVYSAPWNMEYLEMYIDESGLRYLNWDHILEVKEKISEDVPLLEYWDIQNIIKQQLKNEFSWVEEKNEYVSLDQTVLEVTLSYSLLPEKNDSSKAILVPTWYAFYLPTINKEKAGSIRPHFIAVHAADGGLVNPVAQNDEEGIPLGEE